jgi:hypothetical protein
LAEKKVSGARWRFLRCVLQWCSPGFLQCSAVVLDDRRFWHRVVQWCSGARQRFWRFPTVRKKVEKEKKKKTQRAAIAIVEKMREKKKKEKGGKKK